MHNNKCKKLTLTFPILIDNKALLESGRVASRRLLPLSSRNVVLMKTVLSYHHACKMGNGNSSSKRGEKVTTGDIPESFVHFLVPLCAVVTRGAVLFSTSSSSNAAAAATAVTNQKEQTIEVMIEGLVEMFEAALEAGLAGLVDPKELSGSGGAAGGSVAATKKTAKTLKEARGTELSGDDSGTGKGSDGGNGGSSGDQVDFPAWVEKSHDVLVPGFRGLIDHITRVHLGLVVEPLPVATAAAGDGDGDDDDAAAASEGGVAAEAESKREGDVDIDIDFGKGKDDDNDEKIDGTKAAAAATAASGRSSSFTVSENEAPGAAVHGEEQKHDEQGQQEGADGGKGNVLSSGTETPPATSGTNGSSGSGNRSGDAGAPLPEVSGSQARAALCALLKPLVTVGLVGHLGADACLFAWDQAVVAGFGVMIPRMAAMVMAAAADKLGACVTFAVMSEALLSHTHLVSVSEGGKMEAEIEKERERKRKKWGSPTKGKP